MRVFKTKLWRALSLTFIPLSAFAICGTTVANSYAPTINGTLGIQTSVVTGGEGKQYYTSDYDNLEEMLQAKAQLLREVGQEGTILLKNDGVLPLKKNGEVTVLGADSFIFDATTGGAAMSGEEVIATRTDLISALKQVGFAVNTDVNSSSSAVIVVIGRRGGEGNDVTAGSLALTGDEKTMIDSAKASGKKVILLISGDESPEIGAYAKDSSVSAILKFGNAGWRGAYGLADVIVGNVSPSGKLVDTYAVSAMSSPAMENFGDYEYENSNKIMASQANKYVSYNEGIYIDYKYYETRYEDCVLNQGNASSSAGATAGSKWSYSSEVLYSYGYGLSYTTFEKKIVGAPSFDDENHTATITVNVKNTGDVSGKEVVQLYAQSPYTEYDKTNKVEKASVQLMGFEKTDTLDPGEDEDITVTINMQWLASYDYTKAKTYIMDDGDYYFAVGNGAHDALNNILAAKGKTSSDGMDYSGDESLVYKWTQSEFDSTTYSTSVYTGEKITNSFDDANINYWIKDAVTYLSRSDWNGTYPETLSLTASADMLSCLNDTKRYENGKWNDTKSRAYSEEVTYTSYTTEDEVNEAINSGEITVKNVVSMREKSYDDEGWNEILDNLSIYEMSRLVSESRYYINACPSAAFSSSTGDDGPIGVKKDYVYYSIDKTTGEKVNLSDGQTFTDGITDDKITYSGTDACMYSSEPVLAATFSKALAERTGAMYGEDGLYTGTSYIWGLGANLHRSTYGGRTSEYYSADSVHTALIGAEVTKASKEHGVVVVIKHFAVNEQEQNRIGVSTFLNEQALRENYLRSFEGISTYGESQGLMTAYNRIGLVNCAEEYDLITVVFQEEWGSKAYLISDMAAPTAGLYDGNASIAAGLSTFLNNGVYNATSGAAVNCTLNVENIKSDSTLLYATREACHRILYNYIHSNAVNGLDENSSVRFVTPWWQPTFTAISVVFTVVAAASAVMYILSVNINRDKNQEENKDEK